MIFMLEIRCCSNQHVSLFRIIGLKYLDDILSSAFFLLFTSAKFNWYKEHQIWSEHQI